MLLRTTLLPLLSLAGLGLATYTVVRGSERLVPSLPVAAPAAAPFARKIAGAGIVEAASQDVAVAAPVPGVVLEVAVVQAQRVERGAVLFRVDDRAQRAERAVRAAEVERARAELARLAALPRPEDLPPVRARVAAGEAELADARTRLALAEAVSDPRAVSQEDLEGRRQGVRAAEAHLAAAEGELARLAAGAWEPELVAARAQLAAAEATLGAADTELERLIVRAPFAGTVLQVNVRAGERTGEREAPIVLGDLARLHVRVDLDESDAWRFRPGASGMAFVRGNPALSTALEFVRVDPYVVPKRSLTGDTVERVDTRVLQVVYAFDPGALPVYVGQQMDVFLEAGSSVGEAK